jgi:XTP/dITP diphosphohydrolase
MGLPAKNFFVAMKLIFATNNQHKVDEMRSAVGDEISIVSLKEAGIDIDIPEPHDDLEKNASEKSKTIWQLMKTNPAVAGCFSEDTGLEAEALNGEPGVKSARYAGEGKSFEKNIEKLLHNMEGISNRRARFRTVISLILEDREYFFEGICPGAIVSSPKGQQGFGYDPVFLPDGAIHTFAEMSLEEKNKFSHRKKAADKLVTFLKQLKQTTKI